MRGDVVEAILRDIFGREQAGGMTMAATIHMVSPTHCSVINWYSSCGGDETQILFDPPLALEEALLHARKFTEKGRFRYPS